MFTGLDEIRSHRPVHRPVELPWFIDEDELDEGIRDWLRGVGKKVKDIFRRKKKVKPPPPGPPVRAKRPPIAKVREKVRVKPDKEAGIPPKPKEKPAPTFDYKRPTVLDPAIPLPKKQRFRPKGQQAISHALLYQHMVRAIYNTIQRTGYPTRGTPAKASQAIARGQLVKWGYAGRSKKKGGVPDRRQIQLTTKGTRRSLSKHGKEGSNTKRAKSADYRAIVTRDPL